MRRCIGAAFALMEMRVVLRGVLERVALSAVRPQPEAPRVRHVTAVPSRGAEVLARPRVGVTASSRPSAREGTLIA